MKSHPSAETIQAFVDGELSAAERRRVLLHFSECESCSEDARDRAEILHDIQESLPAPDARLLADIRGRLFASIEDNGCPVDVQRLLGHAPAGAALKQQLEVFLGVRAATCLQTSWL